ncbi:hypothetical protein IBL50_001039 [Salmonella enterica subsp. enterica serovar Nigeria]|uniref:Uncharacterized protein n=1 Tax=Salmonella enteritidis TaxID=149539 RepID=A0A5V0B8L4_SALEN|nr:hypothetical protein [Salmonella enterica subsp. enterica]EBR5150640.1 hypothetical protein [Salmonella enterica]EBS5458877.1 hypothetical protein [Salmonella enterica subsp. enterica serovar Enteritidis]ECR4402980.1 hypothetical protein [Salmonella enterica subsp. enterica serovar Ona]ECY7870692.1 hypothetical protein [Salmonella enterica subsp. enterica serovar Wilhelmsburg]EDQ7128193.1 hypothetical protein [Salmonella enterica subsp. enterica serovar Fischerhuette]EEC6742601.1 hypotheti
MQPLFEKEIMMKQRYRVEAVMASSKKNNLEVPREVMDVLCEQVCSSLQIPEIIERLASLGYRPRYEVTADTLTDIATLWIWVGQEEMLLNCQMEPLAVH